MGHLTEYTCAGCGQSRQKASKAARTPGACSECDEMTTWVCDEDADRSSDTRPMLEETAAVDGGTR